MDAGRKRFREWQLSEALALGEPFRPAFHGHHDHGARGAPLTPAASSPRPSPALPAAARRGSVPPSRAGRACAEPRAPDGPPPSGRRKRAAAGRTRRPRSKAAPLHPTAGSRCPRAGPDSSAAIGTRERHHTKYSARSSAIACGLPALREIIEPSPCGEFTFLVMEFGKPFAVAGFGNWLRGRCGEAGLKGVAGHELRKAVRAIGAEHGLTDRELMAIAGHSTSKEKTRYTAAAERTSLARSGMAKLEEERLGNESVSPENGVVKSGTIRPKTAATTTAVLDGGAPGRDRTSTPCGTRF